MEYLVRPDKNKTVAHIWTGQDTACTMYSTGSNTQWSKYKVTGTDCGRKVCTMCESNMQKIGNVEAASYIAEDIKKARSAQSVSDSCDEQSSLGDKGGTASAFVKSFEGLVDHWVGYLVLLSQDFEDDGQHISRSAAVRVDNVSEVIRVLEVLFKR